MLVAGHELRASDQLVVWWIGAGEHRYAAGGLPIGAAKPTLERLARLLPGQRVDRGVIAAALGKLAEPGQPVVVRGRGGAHVVGLVRPFAVGPAGPGRHLVAAVTSGEPRLALLGADAQLVDQVAAELATRTEAPAWEPFTYQDLAGAGALDDDGAVITEMEATLRKAAYR